MSTDQLGYTYAETQDRDTSGGHYANDLDDATAEATTDLLTVDADYLDAIADIVSGALVAAFNTAVTTESIHTGGNGVLLTLGSVDVGGSVFANLENEFD